MYTYQENLAKDVAVPNFYGDEHDHQSNTGSYYVDIAPKTSSTVDPTNRGVEKNVSNDNERPIFACLRANSLQDSLSSTMHTDTNMTQDSSNHGYSIADFSFDDPYTFDGSDDVSITDEFFEDSASNFGFTTTNNQGIAPECINGGSFNEGNYRINHHLDSFSSIDHISPSVSCPPQFAEEQNNNNANMDRSMASLNEAFENLNKCMERSSQTRAIIKEFSESNPSLHPGNSATQQQPTIRRYQQYEQNLSKSSSSLAMMKTSIKRNGSFGSLTGGKLTRRNGSSGSLLKSASLSEMKRSGVAPRKAIKKSFLSTKSSVSKAKLSNGMKNNLMRDLYSSSISSKTMNQLR